MWFKDHTIYTELILYEISTLTVQLDNISALHFSNCILPVQCFLQVSKHVQLQQKSDSMFTIINYISFHLACNHTNIIQLGDLFVTLFNRQIKASYHLTWFAKLLIQKPIVFCVCLRLLVQLLYTLGVFCLSISVFIFFDPGQQPK